MITMSVDLNDLSGAVSYYISPPVTCRLVKAYTALITALTTGDSTITLSDGTTDIGVITITQSGSAAGDVDEIVLDSTSLGAVELAPSTPLKVVNDATPGQGRANLTLLFSEFHSDI